MHVDKYESYWIILVSAMLGLFAAALIVGAVVFGVQVPSFEGYVNPNELGDTIFANPGVYDRGDGEYEVVMLARMWSFDVGGDRVEVTLRDGETTRMVPVVRVPVGAHVTFTITSVDVTHGFLVEHHNANVEIVPGQIAQTSTTFDEVGEFHFLCHEYCGQLHQEMWGVIIVEDPNAEEEAAEETE